MRTVLAMTMTLYVLSTQKFVFRDPVGVDVGVQGLLEVALPSAAAAMLALCALWKNRLQMPPAPFWFFAAFGMFALASSPYSFYPPLSAAKALLWGVTISVAALACSTFDPDLVLSYFYWAVVGVITVGLVVGLAAPSVYPLFSSNEYTGRVLLAIFASHPGSVAALSSVTFLLGRVLRKQPPRLVQWSLVAVNIGTSNKASTATLILVLLGTSLLTFRYSTRGIALVCAAGAASVVLIVAGPALMESHGDVVSSAFTNLYGDNVEEEVASLDGRLDLWTVVSGLLHDRILLGYGIEGARDVLYTAVPWAGQAHNGVLDAALAAGLVGTVVLLAGFGLVLRILAAPSSFRPQLLGIAGFFTILCVTEPVFLELQYIGPFVALLLCYVSRSRREWSPAQ
jgi:O-antigen ligase